MKIHPSVFFHDELDLARIHHRLAGVVLHQERQRLLILDVCRPVVGCVALAVRAAALLLDVKAVVYALLLAPRAGQRLLGGGRAAANLRRPLSKLPDRAGLCCAHQVTGSPRLSPQEEKQRREQRPGDQQDVSDDSCSRFSKQNKEAARVNWSWSL